MENDLELKRLEELAARAARTGVTQFTRFIDPALTDAVRQAAGRQRAQYRLYGGYPDAERVMAAFYDTDPPGDSEWPMQALRIAWNPKFAHPAHRDLLGAVLGLGIDREATGDIALATWQGAPCAVLFATREMASYIAASLESAGRAAVKVTVADEVPDIAPPEGREVRVTVQQPRLDAVLAAGYDLSRAQAQKLIAAGLVKLDHVPNTHTDAQVGEGSLISARGHGRLKVAAIQGQSRRGRLVMSLFRYGK
ncbi:MAG: hypothetical protein IJ646_00290 [Clostridia bacterium]|nr:hypothetical protein [Clostridia bacterium]